MGFQLKPNKYQKSNWCWLLRNIEKRIGNWTNRFLPLHGKFVLVKYFIESIPIYCLSLAIILESIRHMIKNMIFNFWWFVKKGRRKFHLVKWETLARPKEYGGWGIKNLFHFGTTLATKNIWKSLFAPGMWNDVIITKYLNRDTVVDWIRNTSKVK